MTRRLPVFLSAVVTGVLLLAGIAPAAAPEAKGWWWFAQPAGAPVDVPTPPYVPAGGLYVASNPSGAEALAALRFRAAGGATLRLAVADARGEVRVGVCRSTEQWQPAEGGALSEAPSYDCSAGSAVGTLSSDGTAVVFPVAALVEDGVLDVVVAPGIDQGGANPTFQVAFAPPGDDALAASPPTTAGETAPPSDGQVDPAPAPEPIGSAGGAVDVGPAPAVAPPAADASFVAAPASPLPPSQPAGEVAAPRAPDGDGDDGNGLRILGYGLLVATAVTYHRLSGIPDRAPRSLVGFGRRGA